MTMMEKQTLKEYIEKGKYCHIVEERRPIAFITFSRECATQKNIGNISALSMGPSLRSETEAHRVPTQDWRGNKGRVRTPGELSRVIPGQGFIASALLTYGAR